MNLTNKHSFTLNPPSPTLYFLSSPISVTQGHWFLQEKRQQAFTGNLTASFTRELVTYLNNWNFNDTVCLQRK